MKAINEDDAIRVCIRMRPLLKPYEDEEVWAVDNRTNMIYSTQGQRQDTSNSFSAFTPTNTSYLNDPSFLAGRRDTRRKYYDNQSPYSFPFDNVAGPELKTQQIYNQVGKSITESVLDGYNGTIFMYGQTTSGKTYTMLGTPDAPGILPCAVRDVFLEINKRKDMLFKVWISYIEIYNEVINDLLSPGVTNLKISEDPKFGVVVNGAKQQQVWSFDQAIILMNYGEESRVYKETNVHEHSSRSHTLFRVFIESQSSNIDAEHITHRYSCLNLVDLAGSERLADYEGKAETMGETGYINKSLFVLANVINKLAEGKKGHIPYRDSKLTRILSQALGGNSLTAIICTISPANLNFYQTLSTLRFATRAKTVKNRPEINELDYGLEIRDQSILQDKINKLQNELMTTREETYKLANAKLEIQISLENAHDRVTRLEQENAFLRSKLEEFTNEKFESDEYYGNNKLNMSSTSASNAEHAERYNSLLQGYNEEKAKRMILEAKLLEQHDESQDLNPKEISFMENLLWNINAIFVENDVKRQVDEDSLRNWFNFTENLAAQYKIEVIGLQNKFRDSLRELVQEFVPECLDEIYNYLTTINSRTNPSTSEEVKKLEAMMQKILNKKAFEHVVFNPQKITNFNDPSAPAKAQAIREEYEKAVKKVNLIYDESRSALEEYSRKKVNTMKIKEPQGKGPKSSKETSLQETNIVNITNDHQEKLSILRRLFEDQLKSLETKYLDAVGPLGQVDPSPFPNPLSILKKTENLSERETNIYDQKSQKKDPRNLQQEKSPKRFESKPEENTAGFVYLWGSGKDGRLGNGSEKSEKVPRKIDYTKFKQISCGYHHNVAIDLNGKVYAWGKGASGQLGTGALENECFPIFISIPNNVNIAQVTCGWQHTIALSTDGQVYSWGKGSDGQLGHDNGEDYAEPVKVKFFEKMYAWKIAAGHSHSAAIVGHGDLYMWGCNLDHRLMIQNHENQYLPSLTELSAIKADESLDVVDVALGVGHSAVVTKNGSVFTGGVGTDGQLGTFVDEDTENSVIIARRGSQDPNVQEDYQDASPNNRDLYERYCFLYKVKTFGPSNKALKISCGDSYSLVLSERGLYSFGKSSHSRLGHENISTSQSLFQPKLIESLRDQKILQISAGCRHAACLNQKGEVYGWGFNFYDQLGLGESDRDVEKPTKLAKLGGKNVRFISCGYFHTGAIVDS